MTTNPKGYNKNWYIKKFAELRKKFGDKCHFCNSTIGLEFAHVKPTKVNGRGRGKYRRYHDIVNNKSSYLLTCKVHNILAESELRA